jgi:hypothetical protein
VSDGIFATQKSVANFPIDVEGKLSTVCTATSNSGGSMRGMCSIVQLKVLIATIRIRNLMVESEMSNFAKIRGVQSFSNHRSE